jgi:Bacterial SCP ortholog
VVETDPRTWLLMATGMVSPAEAHSAGSVSLSGSRAGEIEHWLPLFDIS